LPEHVDDLLAVMDAVESRRAALFGVVDGGAIALLTAVAHPDRVAGVATYAAAARVLRIQELDLLFEVVRRRRGRARA
jgi:pimeloyl-ACP methyl ester carboxylesterase